MKAGIATLILLLGANACSSHTSKTSPSPGPTSSTPASAAPATRVAANGQLRREVAITTCAGDRLGHVEVKGTARNSTSTAATYAVEVTIQDPSGKHFYVTVASASRVPTARTAQWNAATTAPFVRGTTCSITNVTRHPS